MTIAKHLRRASLALLALTSVGAYQSALAAPGQTTAGTDITNTATVSYSVGTVAQTPINSNTVTFEVDRFVDLSVSDNGAVTTAPGSTNVAVMFTVANTGNDADSYTLTVDPNRPGDDFDVADAQIYLDDGDGVFDAGDTLIAAPMPLARDTSAVVFVVANIPLTAVDGQSSIVRLTAATSYPETAGNDNAGAVDTVWADDNTDGTEFDDNTYNIESATLSVTKAAVVIDDGFGTAAPQAKAIPGATVEYTITVANTGSQVASNVVVADAIPENTTYVAGSLSPAGTEVGTPVTNVSTTILSVAAGATATVTFRVVIN